MRIDPEISGASIVLVGSLNPRIFTPDWFARNKLLTATEAEAAELEVVHEELTAFRMNWLNVRVEKQRFIAETNEAPFIRLCDLTVRVFKEFLIHTPLGRMGINRMIHFNVGDENTRNRVGRVLAPLEPWGAWGAEISKGDELITKKAREKELDFETLRKRGGMMSLVMQQSYTGDDRPAGYIQVTTQPSVKIRQGAGIYMCVNDHYEIKDADEPAGAEAIIEMLPKQFEKSIERSEAIIDQVMALSKAIAK